ncbi:11419_t:CDS:2 [Entrophospora sp. SA101]|nr:11419_t:CDS:2 [Entrophospora sp. SA101]
MSGRNNSYNDQYTYDSKLYASVTPATDNSLQQPIHQSHQYQHYNNNIDSKYTNYPTSTNKTYQQNSYNYSSPPSFNNYYYHQPPTGPASTSKIKLSNSVGGMGKNNFNQKHNSSMKDETIDFKQKTIVRAAGGEVWEDSTLLEWDSNDFRLFCGDLGNEVTDDMLYKAFSKYLSIQKTKVIRDKRTGKSKGYGFVSFKDADEFVKAWKEMNGKYVGNRPIKLRKSNWKDRNFDAKSKKHHPY